MLHKHGKIGNRSASGFLSSLRRFENDFWHFDQKQQFLTTSAIVRQVIMFCKITPWGKQYAQY